MRDGRRPHRLIQPAPEHQVRDAGPQTSCGGPRATVVHDGTAGRKHSGVVRFTHDLTWSECGARQRSSRPSKSMRERRSVRTPR